MTSICAVVIGPGGAYRLSDDGQSSGGGGGGGLMYANNIPVTPGETLRVSSTRLFRGSTVLIGVSAGSTQNGSGSAGTLNAAGGTPFSGSTAAGRVGYSGGAGRRWNGAVRGGGGGAAGYGSNGAGAGQGSNSGASTSLLGPNRGQPIAGGGSGTGAGALGGIRIIWGDGRSYPNNAL